MEHVSILQDLIIVMAVSLIVAYGLQKLKIPILVGFLLAGVLIGPGGLSLVHDRHSIEMMAEIGVVFLLFTIGLKFSLAELTQMKQIVFGAGAAQVAGTIAAGAALSKFFGMDVRQALFLGFLLTMSSTAIVIRLLEERGETDTVHGKFSVGILIFQDLAVVPLMLLVPLMGGEGEVTIGGALITLLKSLGMIALILGLARFLIPFALEKAAAIRSREVFTLSTILCTIGTAWLAGQAGLSLALGAFLAGIVISESDYSQQMLTEIAPLRDSFSSLFFISIGMLVDPRMWLAHPVETVGYTVMVIGVKALIVILIGGVFRTGVRVAVLGGMALAQIGEFSFILAREGLGRGLITEELHQSFLSVSVATMAVTPFAMMLSPWLAGKAQRLGKRTVYVSDPALSETTSIMVNADGVPVPRENAAPAPAHGHPHLDDHVIIVGYGVNGKNVARVLNGLGVKYLILELNLRTVRQVRAEGEAINYGDATREDVLRFACVESARALVMAIADRESSRQVVALAKRLNPRIVVIVRTRFIAEVDELHRLGADEVVPEEFETSLELASCVMEHYGASTRAIEKARQDFRCERYEIMRGKGRERKTHLTLDNLLTAAELTEIPLAGDSAAVGRSLLDMHLRERTGASIIAVGRGGEITANPPANFVLAAEDVLFIFGSDNQIQKAREILSLPDSSVAPETGAHI